MEEQDAMLYSSLSIGERASFLSTYTPISTGESFNLYVDNESSYDDNNEAKIKKKNITYFSAKFFWFLFTMFGPWWHHNCNFDDLKFQWDLSPPKIIIKKWNWVYLSLGIYSKKVYEIGFRCQFHDKKVESKALPCGYFAKFQLKIIPCFESWA